MSLNLCRLILEACHERTQDSWQKIALFVGVSNSIMNPIVYGFWYSEFRLRIVKGWKAVFRKLCGNQ